MRARRYEVRDRITIAAPIERVYAIATDPAAVPLYAGEIVRLEFLDHRQRDADTVTADVVSHFRLFGRTPRFRYRYRYRRPTYYGGVQVGGRLIRGYFTMRFRATAGGTEVEHAEGLISRTPCVAAVAGRMYFRLLHGAGTADELRRLKDLVERSPAARA